MMAKGRHGQLVAAIELYGRPMSAPSLGGRRGSNEFVPRNRRRQRWQTLVFISASFPSLAAFSRAAQAEFSPTAMNTFAVAAAVSGVYFHAVTLGNREMACSRSLVAATLERAIVPRASRVRKSYAFVVTIRRTVP